MKKRVKYLFFIVFATLVLFLTSCTVLASTHKKAKNNVSQETTHNVNPERKKPSNEDSGNSDINNKKILSGETGSLPWDYDENFLKAKEQAGTDILMGAYHTVLSVDPLPGELENMRLAASMLNGRIIKPGEVFSQNQAIGPYTADKGYQKGPTFSGSQIITTTGGGVCKVASTLYNVAVLSDLQIVERHAHSMPVPYVNYGQDATVSYGAKDIKFKNGTDFPILVWAKGIENHLYIAFYGKKNPGKVTWHHKFLNTTEPPVIYNQNPSLEKGKEKVIIEGAKGAVVDSWVTIENPDGQVVTKERGRSYYNPMPYIIEKGIKE